MPKRYNVGVIGTGWAARSPLPTFASYDRTNLVAVCSARLERARAAAAEFGAAHAYDDYRAMVARPDLDIVYVGTPVYLHYPMVMAALAAGKHVLCEKPLALDEHEAREMLAMAERHGLKHVVAFTMRHYPWSQKVKQLVADGFLGELRHMNVTQFLAAPSSAAVAQPEPSGSGAGRGASGGRRAWSWVNDAALGGGMLGAMGSHWIDLTNDWTGGFRQVSGHLQASRGALPTDAGELKPATADEAFAISGVLRTAGALFTLQFGANLGPGTTSRAELYGSEGTILVENAGDPQVARQGAPELRPVAAPQINWPEAVAAAAVPRFAFLIWKLIQAIEDPGYAAHPDFRDGLRCQQIMDAVRRSHDEGQTVILPDPPDP